MKSRIFRQENPESVSSFSDGIACGTCRARASPTFAWEKSRQPEAEVTEKIDMTAHGHHHRHALCADARQALLVYDAGDGVCGTGGRPDEAEKGRGRACSTSADVTRRSVACQPTGYEGTGAVIGQVGKRNRPTSRDGSLPVFIYEVQLNNLAIQGTPSRCRSAPTRRGTVQRLCRGCRKRRSRRYGLPDGLPRSPRASRPIYPSSRS